MTSNKLKIIACISMTLDHVGYLLFPKVVFLRYIGRLALLIFAFFIAEGCLHTRSKAKYLLQISALAIVCQLFYVGEALLNGGIRSIDLNILFTFCLSIIISSSYLRLKSTLQQKNKKMLPTDIILFIASLSLAVFCCTYLSELLGISVTIDYGLVGVLLPVSALLFSDKRKNLISFCVGTVIYCIVRAEILPYTWFALLSLPLLFLYNGKRGTKKLKWPFYFFYPLHFAVIYGIHYLMSV